MELLDRYLEAVKKHLPWQRQDDIIAELRANLEAQLEEKEAALGRPLTQAEVEAWLKQLGSPMQMAAPYQPQQYLIGPAIFPIYRNVMKIAITWCIVIYSIATATALLTKAPQLTDFLHALMNVPMILITTAAWVTLVFAALEYAMTHHRVKLPGMSAPAPAWSPSALPPLDLEAHAGGKRPSYAQAVANLIFGYFFLIWLLLVPKHPYLLMGPGAYYLASGPFQLAHVWVPAYWCVVALSVLQFGWNAHNLFRGRWQKPHRAAHLVLKAVGMVPLILLLTAKDHATVLLKHPALDQVRYGATLDGINRSINWSVALICAIAGFQLVWGIVQLILNAYRKRAAASL
ncbi:MAG: HAAS signaling domain-containing protein [Terracidiphilus sp.]